MKNEPEGRSVRRVGNFLVFKGGGVSSKAININHIVSVEPRGGWAEKAQAEIKTTAFEGMADYRMHDRSGNYRDTFVPKRIIFIVDFSPDEILQAIDQDDVQEGGVVPCSAWETCQCEKCVIERKEGAKKTDARTDAMARLVMELLQDPAIEWNVCHWERNLSDERRICYEYEKHSSRYWANIGVRDRSHDTFLINVGPEPHGSWSLNRTGTFKELFRKFQDKLQMTADTGGCYHTKKAL